MKWVVRFLGVVFAIALLVFVGLLAGGGAKGQGQNSVTIEITSPSAQVFTWLTEPEKLKKWMGGLVESTPLTEGGLRVGARSREVVQVGEERTEMEVEITALRKNERLEARITSKHFEVNSRYILSEKSGKTRVTYIGDAQFKGFFFKLLTPLITPMAQKKLEEDFARLKQMVEAEGKATS